jgi:hypothetical protein
MAVHASAFADEDLEATLRRLRIGARRRRLPACERIAKLVEGCASADERFQESRNRLPDVDEDRFVVVCGRGLTKSSAIATRKLLVTATAAIRAF